MSADIPDFYSFEDSDSSKTSNTIPDFYSKSKEEIPDFYSDMESGGPSYTDKLKELFTPKKQELKTKEGEEAKSTIDIYRPKEISAEDIKKMTLEEKREWIEDNKLYQDFVANQNMLSAATFGGSEYLTGEPEQPHHGASATGMGISGTLIYRYFGIPLVNLITRNPIARQSVSALERITAMGFSGSGHKAITSAVQVKYHQFQKL